MTSIIALFLYWLGSTITFTGMLIMALAEDLEEMHQANVQLKKIGKLKVKHE